MKPHCRKVTILLGAAAIAASIFFGIAHAYRTKIVTVNLDTRINIDQTVRQIEELSNAKVVSAFRNISSLYSSNKIDQIKLTKMINQGIEEGVVWRGIGHVWMTGSNESDLVMLRLMIGGDVKVTRLYTSMCPPSPPSLIKKPNKS
jgi:hypothetical protein